MNILKRIPLQQIAAKKDVIKSIIDMQRLQIQRFLHTKSLVNSIKPLHCGTMWYSTEGNGDKSTKITGGVEAAAVAKTVKPKRTLKDKIIDYFASSKSIIAGRAVLVYGHSVDQLNHMEFVTKFKMPNTFYTWFLITELHVWMLMVRAMSEHQDGPLIRNNIIETLWSDVSVRANTLAPDDARVVKKQIEELTGQLQYAIILYDEGLTKDDKQLASALWTRLFNSNYDNYEHIELMVKYVRYNIAALDKLTTEQFLKKRNYIWPSLKDMESGKY